MELETALLFFFLPLFQGEEEVEMSSTELLYQGILPSLPQYMVGDLCWLINAECLKVFYYCYNYFIWQSKRQKTQLPVPSKNLP